MALRINRCVVRRGRVQGIPTPSHKLWGTRPSCSATSPACWGSGLGRPGEKSLRREWGTGTVPSRTPVRPQHTLGKQATLGQQQQPHACDFNPYKLSLENLFFHSEFLD